MGTKRKTPQRLVRSNSKFPNHKQLEERLKQVRLSSINKLVMAYIYNKILQQKIVFDTLSLTFNSDALVSVNNEVFTDTKNVTGVMKDVLIDDSKPFGINCLKIGDDKIELTISAKILGANYPKGISTETIDKLIVNLNSTGISLL